jgi:hypothetical protein
MSQTRSYTKAVSILRQLHDALFAQIDSLQTFLDDNMQYFETKHRDLEEQWKCYLDRIASELIHLRRWQRGLMQRIQRFDGMKDGVGSNMCLCSNEPHTDSCLS